MDWYAAQISDMLAEATHAIFVYGLVVFFLFAVYIDQQLTRHYMNTQDGDQ